MDRLRLYRWTRGFLVALYGAALLVGTAMFFSELPVLLAKPFEARLGSVVTILLLYLLAKFILEMLLEEFQEVVEQQEQANPAKQQPGSQGITGPK